MAGMGRLQFKVGCGEIWRGQGFTNKNGDPAYPSVTIGP